MVRDEAHRFAVTFHRTRRNASRLRSELDQIPGVGEKTVAKLLRHFGSLERVREASEEELAEVVGRAAAASQVVQGVDSASRTAPEQLRTGRRFLSRSSALPGGSSRRCRLAG